MRLHASIPTYHFVLEEGTDRRERERENKREKERINTKVGGG